MSVTILLLMVANFRLIQDWSLSPHDVSLWSFIGLSYFYIFCYLRSDVKIKPFKRLRRIYYRNDVHIMGLTPSLIQLFVDWKNNIVTSLILIRHDSSKPFILKIDWYGGEIDYILMQRDDYPAPLISLRHLALTGKYRFDLSLNGLWFRFVLFDFRSNIIHDQNYDTFLVK